MSAVTPTQLESARSVFRAHYYNSVRETAEFFLSRLAKNEFSSREDFMEVLRSETTSEFEASGDKEAYDAVFASDVSTAILTSMPDFGVEVEDPNFMERWAIECFRADVLDRMAAGAEDGIDEILNKHFVEDAHA